MPRMAEMSRFVLPRLTQANTSPSRLVRPNPSQEAGGRVLRNCAGCDSGRYQSQAAERLAIHRHLVFNANQAKELAIQPQSLELRGGKEIGDFDGAVSAFALGVFN